MGCRNGSVARTKPIVICTYKITLFFKPGKQRTYTIRAHGIGTAIKAARQILRVAFPNAHINEVNAHRIAGWRSGSALGS